MRSKLWLRCRARFSLATRSRTPPSSLPPPTLPLNCEVQKLRYQQHQFHTNSILCVLFLLRRWQKKTSLGQHRHLGEILCACDWQCVRVHFPTVEMQLYIMVKGKGGLERPFVFTLHKSNPPLSLFSNRIRLRTTRAPTGVNDLSPAFFYISR